MSSSIVVFIPLYTLAGAYICSPLQCFPLNSIYNFYISKFISFHFPYIVYSTFSIILIVFPVLFFQCPLFLLPRVIFSNYFPVVFPVRRSSHFPYSRPVISLVFFLPDVTFPVFLSSWLFLCFSFPVFLRIHIVFSQFGATYFNHFMYTNCRIPNFLLVCFVFASSFSVSILPFHCLRISVPSINTRHSLQNIVFPEFSSKVRLNTDTTLKLLNNITFQAVCFSCCLSGLSLGSGSARWRPLIYSYDSVILDWSSAFVFLATSACRQFPLLPI